MPVHPHRPRRAAAVVVRAPALAVVLALELGGCAVAPAGPATQDHAAPAAPAVDPATADDGDTPAPDGVEAYEIVLTSDLRDVAAGRPDAQDAVIEMRLVVVGDRTHLVTRAGGRVLDQHVATADEHWLWVPPELRDHVVDAEWLHFDVAAIDEAGLPLPRHVAAARGPMPEPGELAAGQLVGGREVAEVQPLPGDAVRVTFADLAVPMTLRRRPLPAGTTIDLPRGAVDVRDVPGMLAG